MVSEIFIKVIAIVLILSVAIVLVLGIGTLFKGGSASKKYSNKLHKTNYYTFWDEKYYQQIVKNR